MIIFVELLSRFCSVLYPSARLPFKYVANRNHHRQFSELIAACFASSIIKKLGSPLHTTHIAVVAMCVECPVYIQSERNGTSSILGTGIYFSHDVSSLSAKFVTQPVTR